ncbi:hypothetical protein ABT352_03825 [Streptosporangium sp. NPDC000563]|uniref:hypothetical protein n=1 Tax=Streptosporangium sp. NPDC000563 TaxID=3154366 RepID=UPI00332D1331
MSMDELRLRVEELSQRFGINPPDVVHGEPPQGADCILKRRGKNSLIVIGAGFDTLPRQVQDADLAWAVAASDRTRVRKEGVSAATSLGLGAVIGLVAAPLIFLFSSPIPAAVVALIFFIMIGMPIMMRQQIYALDRRVAEVCGKEMLHQALTYWQEHPPRMRGLYRLVLKVQPSMAKRAARLAPANM